MAIRTNVIVACDYCLIEGIPDHTTIPKGWINFSHRHVEGGVTTYYFCSVECMQKKIDADIIEVRKTKLRRTSGAANKEPIVYDDWPAEWAEAIDRKVQQLYEEQNSRSRGIGPIVPPPGGHPTPIG